MTIEINIRANNQAEYKSALQTLMEGSGFTALDFGDATAPQDGWAPGGSTQTEDTHAPAPQTAAVQAPVPSAGELPIEAPKPAQKPAQKPADALTIEDLQALGRKLALSGRMDKVKAVLDKYGAAKITELPAEHWAAAKAEWEADHE